MRNHMATMASSLRLHLPIASQQNHDIAPYYRDHVAAITGAGMARTYKAAAFVKGKIPFGQGNTLTDQEAVDVASYFTHLPRPVKANKDKDWPKGGAPVDVRR
ncbi:MAG: c-type cytochrome [Psychrobacter celer]|uniref:c-type cytochrome n=1 Tax=Psychrobacter celer TaxID=306572 RepID=UPI003FB7AB17